MSASSNLSCNKAFAAQVGNDTCVQAFACPLQAAFHVFGMELLAQLDIQATNNFFSTFFRLPDHYWRGFLASSLTSRQLIAFAMWMMVRAPPSIQLKLMQHMLLDPAGKYMLRTYAGWSPRMMPSHILFFTGR